MSWGVLYVDFVGFEFEVCFVFDIVVIVGVVEEGFFDIVEMVVEDFFG